MKATSENIEEQLTNIASSLAINYWNSSLSTHNQDYIDENSRSHDLHNSAEFVFSNSLSKQSKSKNFSTYGFTRNILIIGAGASKNAYEPLLTASELIKRAYTELGIFETLKYSNSGNANLSDSEIAKLYKTTLGALANFSPSKQNGQQTNDYSNGYIVEKFISYSFHQLGKMKDYDMTVSELLDELEFEGAIVVAHKFVEKHHFNKCLSNLLHYKYIPNLFYEIVAHLFKHRFIDVVINLNFDELLDNAIEDEMGSGEYLRIYNDASCSEFGDAIVDDRLRKPLYIKPHGTISDIDSILYSKSQYIDINPALMNVLSSVFNGHTNRSTDNKSNKTIKQFNIIAAGFAFRDPDIVSVVAPNLSRNGMMGSSIRTTLHIFDHNPSQVLINLFEKISQRTSFTTPSRSNPLLHEMKLRVELRQKKISFDCSVKSEKIRNSELTYEEVEDQYHKDLAKSISEYHFKSINLYSTDNDNNLDSLFLKMYSIIQSCFKAPFIPTIPIRHLWNCAIFNKSYLADYEGAYIQQSDLLYNRAKANILFDFYKFNGCVPNHLIYSDRAGKYFKLYRSRKKSVHEAASKSLSQFISEIFCDKESNVIVANEMRLEHQKFYSACFGLDKTENDKTINEVREKLCSALKAINPAIEINGKSIDKLKTCRPYENSVKSIPYGTSHELAPDYLDDKHFRFEMFRSMNIINTNLSLTWQFYEFAVLKKDWNKLIIVGNTGSAFFNLDRFQGRKTPTHLHEIITRTSPKVESVHIFHTVPVPVQFPDKGLVKENEKPMLLKEKYGKCPAHPVFNAECKVCELYRTKIKLEKIEDYSGYHKIALFLSDDEPKHGIYFFNPSNKSRINPVWFSSCRGERYNKPNLAIIKSLLVQTIGDKFDM